MHHVGGQSNWPMVDRDKRVSHFHSYQYTYDERVCVQYFTHLHTAHFDLSSANALVTDDVESVWVAKKRT